MYYDEVPNAVKKKVKVNLSYREANLTISMSKALNDLFMKYKLTTASFFS